MPLFDAASSAAGTTVSSLTFAHTCTGANGLLTVTGGAKDATAGDRQITGVTYNAVALSNQWDADQTTMRGGGWSLIAPATGANNIVVTYGGTADACCAGGQSYTDVNQSGGASTFGTPATATGNSTTASVAVGSATGEVVVGGVSTDENAVANITPTGTERWELAAGVDTAYGGQDYAGAASVTVQWALSNGRAWAIGGVSIKPAAGGAQGAHGLLLGGLRNRLVIH